jgi:hypothetical protein
MTTIETMARKQKYRKLRSPRNPYVVPVRKRKAGPMKDKRKQLTESEIIEEENGRIDVMCNFWED